MALRLRVDTLSSLCLMRSKFPSKFTTILFEEYTLLLKSLFLCCMVIILPDSGNCYFFLLLPVFFPVFCGFFAVLFLLF